MSVAPNADYERVTAERDRFLAALIEITKTPCGIPGHAVAVGCKASLIAWKATHPPLPSIEQLGDAR
jgi:hypothetical protein